MNPFVGQYSQPPVPQSWLRKAGVLSAVDVHFRLPRGYEDWFPHFSLHLLVLGLGSIGLDTGNLRVGLPLLCLDVVETGLSGGRCLILLSA
jgi:hypothetical protein